jgi:hypothetical protein
MEAADRRKRDDLSSAILDGPSGRRIIIERHVRSVLVVISEVLTNEMEQMALTQDDDVVEQLSSKHTDAALGVAVLPRGTKRGSELLEAKVFGLFRESHGSARA